MNNLDASQLRSGYTLPNLLTGLSGNSYSYYHNQKKWHLRSYPQQPIPHISRKREYRILQKLKGSGITSSSVELTSLGLIQAWIPGKPLKDSEFHPSNRQLTQLIFSLYKKPLSGYPLSLSSLLLRYWQLCQAKCYAQFRLLKRLLDKGSPTPLRTALLHMDLHAGNIIREKHKLYLIDWEYAGDGCLALELATLCWQQPFLAEEWLSLYAEQVTIAESLLRAQVRRWRPWLGLLQTFWHQLHYEQTGDKRFKQWSKESFEKI